MANTNKKGSDLLDFSEDRLGKEYEHLKKISEQKKKLSIEELKWLQAQEIKSEVEAKRASIEQAKKLDKEASDLRKEQYEQEGKHLAAVTEKYFGTAQKTADTIVNAAASISSSLQGQLDSVINTYVEAQQKMTAHLVGSGKSFSGISGVLNSALTSSSLVSQEAVYKNLSTLINKGINYNVEQRAFLQTISDDLGMHLDATDYNMNQLVRIFQKDITSNRVAMEYTLQEFLNENYKTSEYIADAFTSVSKSLATSQSLMSSTGAMAYESTIQSWLGAYYSSGVSSNTVTSIASALDKLSSGDVSGVGQGISNLILMGVANAGLDYGSLLNNNLSSTDVSKIMRGVSSYLSSLDDYESNVAKSQLAKLFGISVSDIAAIGNLGSVGGASTNIGSLFGNYNSTVPLAKQIKNTMSNFMYSWGTNIASNDSYYMTYEVTKLLANALSAASSGVNISAGFLGNGVTLDMGQIFKALPLLGMLDGFIETLGDVTNLNSSNMTNVFNALGYAKTSSVTTKSSGAGVSGSMYMNMGDTGSIMDSAVNSVSNTVDTSKYTGEEEDPLPMIQSDVADILSEIKTTFTYAINSIETDVNSIKEILGR